MMIHAFIHLNLQWRRTTFSLAALFLYTFDAFGSVSIYHKRNTSPKNGPPKQCDVNQTMRLYEHNNNNNNIVCD